MLVKPNLDELLPRTENRYTLAMLVAKRARQLIDGGQPMEDSGTPNPVSLSAEEVALGRVLAVEGQRETGYDRHSAEQVVVPLRPEVLEARYIKEQMREENQRLEIQSEGFALPSDEPRNRDNIDLDLLNDLFSAAAAQEVSQAVEGQDEQLEATGEALLDLAALNEEAAQEFQAELEDESALTDGEE